MMLFNCTLQGYKLFRDDGAGGSLNVECDPALNNSPITLEDTINFTAPDLGKTFRFQLQAITISGLSVYSGITFVTLADVPQTPLTGPVNIPTLTND